MVPQNQTETLSTSSELTVTNMAYARLPPSRTRLGHVTGTGTLIGRGRTTTLISDDVTATITPCKTWIHVNFHANQTRDRSVNYHSHYHHQSYAIYGRNVEKMFGKHWFDCWSYDSLTPSISGCHANSGGHFETPSKQLKTFPRKSRFKAVQRLPKQKQSSPQSSAGSETFQ